MEEESKGFRNRVHVPHKLDDVTDGSQDAAACRDGIRSAGATSENEGSSLAALIGR